MRSSNPSASVFWKSEAEGAPSPKHHDVQPDWRVRCHFYEHSKGMLYRNQPFNIHTTILLMQADEWQLSSGSCRSPDSRQRRQCSNYGRSQPAIGLHRTQPVPIIHSPQKLHYSGLFRTVPAPSPKVDAPPHLTDRGITRLSTDTIAWLLLYFHQLLRGYTKHMPG